MQTLPRVAKHAQSICTKSCRRSFSVSATRRADFTHAVIGGGVVGLAVARKLQQREGASVVLIERHRMPGMETSSRNSEVIHAGIYYGPDSLKTNLCVRGKEMLYEYCSAKAIPYRNCGKWIVAQSPEEANELTKTEAFCKSIGVPIHFLSREEAERREPAVRARETVLESPTTGIVDSHNLMLALQGDFENEGGMCAFGTAVTDIEAEQAGVNGWTINTSSSASGESDVSISGGNEETTTITADTLINAAGLAAIPISNSILPAERQRKPFYCKGSYFSYAPSTPKVKTLIYPAPRPGLGGLGTHLTLDISGRMRFGPDVEWVDDPTDLRPSPDRLVAAKDAITDYLPSLDTSALALDYSGIRPKLGRSGVYNSKGGKTAEFNDFYIVKEEGFQGFINLLGIESPGLTSCLAIGEHVEKLLYK